MKNVDVEDFVNRIINDDLIRTIELNFKKGDMDKFFRDSKGAPDDYDQKFAIIQSVSVNSARKL